MSGNEILNVVITAALKGTVILALAAIVTATWRSASAATRHLVWTIAVSLCVAMPLIGPAITWLNAPRIVVSKWTPALPPLRAVEQPAKEPASTMPPAANRATGVESSNQVAPVVTEEKIAEPPAADPVFTRVETRSWKPSLTAIWLTGVIVALIPFLTAVVRIRIVARKSRRVTSSAWYRLIESTPSIAHLAGRVQILESDSTAMPMTWGLLYPVLLVPAKSDRWPEWQRRDVLLHELAHVERHDCLTQLVAQVACAVYWFNPLVWIAAHRMRVERELACDDRVIASGSKASDYAANLLDVARTLRAPTFTSQTAIAMARPSQLSGRLLAVLDPRRNRRSVTRTIAFVCTTAALAVALPIAAVTTRANAAPIVSQPAAVIAAIQVPTSGIASAAATPQDLEPQQSAACWANRDGNTSVSIQSNDDKENDSYTVKYSRSGCSLELRSEGKFTMRADLSDIESISRDGWLRLEEREGRSSRRMEIRRADNGTIEHLYWVNGDRAPYDENARAWLARTLLSVERRTAFAAETRVPQIYRNGGVNAVLNEISQMQGDYAAAKYFGTLLDMDVSLDANALNAVVRRATTDLQKSDYYMSEVLGRLASQRAANETTWQLFAEAAGRMKSDYYQSVILKRVLQSGRLSNETVGMLLKAASNMKSDYYLSDLLKSVAKQYAMNASTRQYYADALRRIESDYYRSDLLGSLGSGDWDARTSAYVLEAIADIKSDYYRSESLAKLVKDNHVNDWNTYFNAVAGIESDYYKKSALVTTLRRSPLTRDIVAGVLSVVPRMRSDSEMSEVLKAVTDRYKIDDSLKPAFTKAVDSIRSDYYRGAALSALYRNGG